MQLSDMRSRVAFIVRGSDSNLSATLRDQIDYGLNEAQRFLHNKVAMMGLRKDGQITLVSGQGEYDLPAGLIRILRGTVWAESRPEQALDHISPQDYTRYGFNVYTDTGLPEAYWVNDYDVDKDLYQIRIVPTPGSGEDGSAVYFKYQTNISDMVGDDETPDLPTHLHEGLVHGCVVLALNKMLEPQALQLHAAAWKDYIKLASKTSDPLLGRRTPMRESSLRSRRLHNRGTFRNFDIDP